MVFQISANLSSAANDLAPRKSPFSTASATMNFFNSAMSAAKEAYEMGAAAATEAANKVTEHVPVAAALQEKLATVTNGGDAAGEGGENKSGGDTKSIGGEANTSKNGGDGKGGGEGGGGEGGDGEKKKEEDDGEKFGDIEFKLDYNFDKQTLSITIIQCKELPAMDIGGTSDPYVKVYILPDKKKKFNTKKLKKTLNPVYNETFQFPKLPFNEMSNKTLIMQIYDHDAVGSDDMIGEVQIPMFNIDLASDNLQYWWPIKEPPKNVLGDICLSLRFAPQKKPPQLTLLVIECKNLKQMDLGGASDPYVKVNHMLNGKRLMKYKTPVKMSELNPYYNQSFKVEVSSTCQQKNCGNLPGGHLPGEADIRQADICYAVIRQADVCIEISAWQMSVWKMSA